MENKNTTPMVTKGLFCFTNFNNNDHSFADIQKLVDEYDLDIKLFIEIAQKMLWVNFDLNRLLYNNNVLKVKSNRELVYILDLLDALRMNDTRLINVLTGGAFNQYVLQNNISIFNGKVGIDYLKLKGYGDDFANYATRDLIVEFLIDYLKGGNK